VEAVIEQLLGLLQTLEQAEARQVDDLDATRARIAEIRGLLAECRGRKLPRRGSSLPPALPNKGET
jgi:hypothetical protein